MVDQRNHWGRTGLVAEGERRTTSTSTTTATPVTTATSADTQPPEETKFIRNPPGPEEIEEDDQGMDIEIEQFRPGQADLIRLSADPAVYFPWYYRSELGFRWKDAGKGVKVYVIDSGCNTRHKVSITQLLIFE